MDDASTVPTVSDDNDVVVEVQSLFGGIAMIKFDDPFSISLSL